MASDQTVVLVPPWIGPAVVGICKSSKSRLVPIINGRRTRPGHLQQNRLTHDLHAHIFHGCRRPQVLRPADHAVGAGQKTGVVMVGQLIHADLESRCRQGLLARAQYSSPEDFRIPVALFISGIAVLLHAGEEIRHGLHEELIVHDGVPFVPLKPFPGIHIVFCYDDSLGIGLLDRFAETLPEFMVKALGITEIRRDVQTPSVRTVRRRDPFAGNVENVLAEALGLFIIEFRQSTEIPPGIIAVVGRPVIVPEPEIIHVRGLF